MSTHNASDIGDFEQVAQPQHTVAGYRWYPRGAGSVSTWAPRRQPYTSTYNPEQAGGLLGQRVAAWATASSGTLILCWETSGAMYR